MTISRRAPTALLVSALVMLLGVMLSTAVGAVHVPLPRVAAVLFGGGSPVERSIVIDLRLPRVLLASLAGGALALSGAVFQALLRNPLADPYVLGISSGAALGAVISMVLTNGSSVLVPVAALIGAVLTIFVVFTVAVRASQRLDARVLLLAGVIISAFLQAVVFLLLTLLNAESFRSAIFWMLGSFAAANWRSVSLLAAYVIPASIVLVGLARALNVLMTGEETALYLGVRVETVTRWGYFIASVLVGASVAACGVVGFVGLVVPHAVRLAFGNDYRIVLPCSLLVGATFLTLSDTIARTVAAPVELPVGVVTALIGVPIFMLLLVRRRA
ncbi:MAG TPA: iron ABC transporter permease [Longimicrobiales bacterium]|nr:iron ABC transporter permease [Longimicrobiales bacterium]